MCAKIWLFSCLFLLLFQELYQISSTGETDNLKSMLIKLQEENRKLRLEYEVSANSQPGMGSYAPPNFDIYKLCKLTSVKRPLYQN